MQLSGVSKIEPCLKIAQSNTKKEPDPAIGLRLKELKMEYA
jgi:hypothetical protein